MLYISFLKSFPTLEFAILTLAYAVFRARLTFLIFNNGHTIFKISLMTPKIVLSSKSRFANIIMLLHSLLLVLTSIIILFKDLVQHLFMLMMHFIILWVLSFQQRKFNLSMLSSISMIHKRQMKGIFNTILILILEFCWIFPPL